MMLIRRGTLIFVLLIASSSVNGNTGKEKLLGLINKLGTIVEKMKFAGAEIKLNTSAALVEKTEAPPAPTEVKTPAFVQDPNKTYCDSFVCPVGKSTAQEMAYVKNFAKSALAPKFHLRCGLETYITLYEKPCDAGFTACASASKFALSLNTDCLWKYAYDIVQNNKKPIPATGMKLWTSGRYATSCDKYVWCPDKEVISDTKWKKGFPKADAGNCVALQTGSKNPEDDGLFNKKCSDSLSIYCTGPIAFTEKKE